MQGGLEAFRLLGRPHAVVGGDEVDLPAGGPSALLACLLLRPSETVGREQLIDALWGESPPRSAVNAVQVYVSALRRAFGPGEEQILHTSGSGYLVDVDRGAVDVHRFRELVAAGRVALGKREHDEAERLFEQALALWTGPPFAALERWSFVPAEAAELESLRLDAREARLEAALELGRYAEVVADAGELILQRPYHEDLRAIRMLALYRSGRQADALAAYHEARRILDVDLGIEPGRRLKDLEAAMLRQDSSLEPTLTPRRPPVPLTPIIGRGTQLADAASAMERGARLLSLVGPGGIGKTRLALEIAHRLDADLPSTFVALESVTDPGRLESAIGAALGLDANRSLIEQLDDRPRLLVLDNFEQIVAAAPLLAEMLAATTRLRMIVTTRIVLRLSAEEVIAVPPLDRDEAVALFVRRAAAVGVRLDERAERSTIEAVCARLDDLPLAIELAAARTTLFGPAVLLERLSRRLDVLTSGSRDRPERHQTMRATIDWSFQLLTPDEQSLVEALAVFVGGASLDGAAAVGEAPRAELERILESLVEKSLFEVTSREPLRLRMLEVVREYALERTDGAERGAAVRARHLAFFCELAESAESRLDSSSQGDVALELERENDNLRTALAYALEADPASAVRLGAALRFFWRIRGRFREGCSWLDAVAERGADADAGLMSKVESGKGVLLAIQGRLDPARDAFEAALAHGQRAGDAEHVARAIGNLGSIALCQGEYSAAQALLTEALKLNRRIGHAPYLVLNLQNLGVTLLCEGDLAGARPLLEEGLELARQVGAPHLFAHAMRECGRVLVLLDETEQVTAQIVRSLEIGLELGDVNGVAQSIELIAGLASHRKQGRLAGEAFALAQQLRGIVGGSSGPDELRWLEMAGFDVAPPQPGADRADEPALEDAVAVARGLLERVLSERH